MTRSRVGLGVDIHPFSDDPARACVLGGVRLDPPGLAGHSDADVIAHAVADAVAGAAGIGDIGEHFPDSDPSYGGADSLQLLEEIVRRAARAGWQLVNADCTLVGERPRVSTHRAEMVEALSAAAGAPVSVKATRPEGLGSLGRGEGLACLAVALVEEVPLLVESPAPAAGRP
jgi:2-C-methyl-D-erythritol 2,4-cyclodiphosphate synthase